jgi:hypothetical protein
METLEPLSDLRDIEYVSRYFITLEEACRRAHRDLDEVTSEILSGLRPAPCYLLGQRSYYVAPDYFDQEIDRSDFVQRYLVAAVSHGLPIFEEDAMQAWRDFLSGVYAVCLWHVTPENIALKDALLNRIDALLRYVREDDRSWLTELAEATDDLDRIERDFSPVYDRRRFGKPITRDTHINDVRRRYLSDASSVL